MRKFFFTFLILTSFGFSAQSNEENMWSFSLGQFDINDTVDSSEIRFEYLYANNFLKNNINYNNEFNCNWFWFWWFSCCSTP